MKSILALAFSALALTTSVQAAELNLTSCRVREIVGDEYKHGEPDGKTIAEITIEDKFSNPHELGLETRHVVKSKKYPGLELEFYWGTGQGEDKQLVGFIQGLTITDKRRHISIAEMIDHTFTKEGDAYRLPKASFYKVYNIQTKHGLDRMIVDCRTNY